MKRELAAIAIVTAVAQLAAFGKLWLIARLFGVGAELDGYYLGFVFPTLITGVLSGTLQTGLFPVYARIDAQKGQQFKERFERLIFYSTAGFAVAIALMLVILAPQVTRLLAGDASPAMQEATAFVLPIAAIAIMFNGVGDYMGYLLAFRGHYVIAAAAPIANATLGAALLAAWPEGGLLNLTMGTVMGVAVQVTICLHAAVRLGFRPFGALPERRESLAVLKEMLQLGAWILPGLVFANLTASLPTVLLTSHGEGSVSAVGYAYRLHQSAIHLWGMAGSPIILARFSQMIAQGELASMSRVMHKAAWISFVIGAVAVIFVWLAGSPFLQLIFGQGRFDTEAANRVAAHWGWLSLGLAPAILGNVLAKSLQAGSRPKMMSLLSGLGLLTLWILAFLLSPLIGACSVPAALACSSAVVSILAWRTVRRSLAATIQHEGMKEDLQYGKQAGVSSP